MGPHRRAVITSWGWNIRLTDTGREVEVLGKLPQRSKDRDVRWRVRFGDGTVKFVRQSMLKFMEWPEKGEESHEGHD